MPTNSALQWLVQTQQQAVSSVQKLDGQTACSQLVTLENGTRYVLREQSQRASDYGVNYQQESQILAAIRPLGFAPMPIYCDDEASLLVWIAGEVPAQFSLELLEKLARQLAALHQFGQQAVGITHKFPKEFVHPFGAVGKANVQNAKAFCQQNFAKLDLAERCHFLWQKLPPEKQAALPFSPPFARVEPFAQALCHHDLHLGNLVVQGDKLFIIDWEYAAMSDPALDLALFLHANSLLEMEREHFLQCYFAAAFAKNPQNVTACRAKISEYQPLIEQLSALWYAI